MKRLLVVIGLIVGGMGGLTYLTNQMVKHDLHVPKKHRGRLSLKPKPEIYQDHMDPRVRSYDDAFGCS